MDKIDIKFDKDLEYIIELKGELVEAKTLMQHGADKLDEYRGATYFLTKLCHKYENLSQNAKIHLNENIEKLAVDTLVKEGYSNTLNKETLEKFGYFSNSGEKF